MAFSLIMTVVSKKPSSSLNPCFENDLLKSGKSF